MIKKLVLSLLFFTLTFAIQSTFAKNKFHKDQEKTASEVCKVEKKKNYGRKEKTSKRIEFEKKSWWSGIFGSRRQLSKEEIRRRKIEKQKAYGLKKVERKARKAQWRVEREIREKEADYQRELRRVKLAEDIKMRRETRLKALKKWRTIRLSEIERDYADGLHADLYKRPAWPFRMLFSHEKNRILVSAGFEHATNYYDSAGSSCDLSATAFGEKEFYFRDILLALELNKRTVGDGTVLISVDANYPWKHLEDYLYDKKLIFFSEENKLDLNFNCGRYIKDRDVFIGFELPVTYKQRRLKFDTDVAPGNNTNEAGVDDVYLRTFQKEIFDYVLRPKNLYYQQKSSVIGLGDISTLINFNIQTKYVEMFKWGGKIVWPTAKEAATYKLWSPELGKGFTQFKVFSSVMFNKQSLYFNPHMFAEFTYVWAGHKNKRVPKVTTYDGVNPIPGQTIGLDVMAHGDRVNYTAIAFSEPDTKIVAFADNVQSIKIRPGAEFNLRIGNIWEKLIARRGFLDVYYDFRAKIKDRILNSGLDEAVWQIRRLEENTMQLEHKAGFDFSYQYDIHSRLNFGCEYTFAGINIPDIFRAILGVAVEF